MTYKKRDFGFDNIKFILIFLVVFGHFLELAQFPQSENIYRFIYIFHVPLLIFVSGYFAKFDKKKILYFHLPLYIIFQFFYIIFEKTINNPSTPIQYTTPYWHLWYLFGLICYLILIPVFDVRKQKNQLFLLTFCFTVGLLAGFDENINRFFNLSRFFVFAPYFLLGFYARKNEEKIKKLTSSKYQYILYFVIILICALSFFLIGDKNITSDNLYGASGYKTFSDVLTRAKLYFCATSYILLFYLILKPILKSKIPLVSTIGKNTLPVYLMHGFLLKLGRYGLIDYSDNPLMVILYSILILIVFGNGFMMNLLNCMVLKPFWTKKNKF